MCVCVCVSIKSKQPRTRLATFFFFCKSSDAVEWSCFFYSLKKMTNASYENAIRRSSRN